MFVSPGRRRGTWGRGSGGPGVGGDVMMWRMVPLPAGSRFCRCGVGEVCLTAEEGEVPGGSFSSSVSSTPTD